MTIDFDDRVPGMASPKPPPWAGDVVFVGRRSVLASSDVFGIMFFMVVCLAAVLIKWLGDASVPWVVGGGLVMALVLWRLTMLGIRAGVRQRLRQVSHAGAAPEEMAALRAALGGSRFELFDAAHDLDATPQPGAPRTACLVSYLPAMEIPADVTEEVELCSPALASVQERGNARIAVTMSLVGCIGLLFYRPSGWVMSLALLARVVMLGIVLCRWLMGGWIGAMVASPGGS
jgi:hypothetical protein